MISQESIDLLAKDGITVERIAPPPADPAKVLYDMYHILRGVQVALDNPMIPEHQHKAVLRGALDGQVRYLQDTFPVAENAVEIIMQALGIQREVLKRS